MSPPASLYRGVKRLFAGVKTGEKQNEGFLDVNVFLLVDHDVNGKLSKRFLIFISPTNTVIILPEKLLSLSYCYDTIVDRFAFVQINIYEVFCIFLFLAVGGLEYETYPSAQM